MNEKTRSLAFAFLACLAFFASGAGCLAAEVTWNRMLIVVVGNSLDAAAMIIVIFMGGLGLGSLAGGRYFSRRRGSLAPYILLEAGIGLYVLASPALFDLLTGLFASTAAAAAQQGSLTLARLLVSTVALLLPAFLMGATFPAMMAGAAWGDPGRQSARAGYLYSVNTIGAALGCVAAGCYLLLERGVQATITAAVGLYATAALCALAAHRLRPRAAPAACPQPEVGEPADPGAADRVPARLLGAATFGVGFVALAYEVLLTRLGILYLGNTVSVFPLVLTAFLLGTGLSAVGGAWLCDRPGRPTGKRTFGLVALGAGMFVLATPYLLLAGSVRGADQLSGLAAGATRHPLPILVVLVLPTILIGALLPMAMRMLPTASSGDATRGAANLYALNTAGGVLGAGLANHVLVPRVGVQNALLLLTAVCVAIGLAVLLPRRRRVLAPGAAVVVAAALALVLPGVMDLYAGRIAEDTGAGKTELLLVREGRAATVTVLDQADPRKGTYRDMYLNGIEEASTRYWHVQLFKLLGVLPGLLHEGEGEKRAAVVAFGAGITAGSVLALDDVASLDVIDLNPDIEGINDLFTAVNGDVFHDPRFRFHNDDGRNFLVTSRAQYDLVISDSTHPRAYDSWLLYTEEFYESVRRRLAPGGVFAQWVPVLDSMRGPLFSIHLGTFRRVFPHATLWYVSGSDQALLLATPGPLAIDAERLQARLDRLPDWFRAGEYRLDTVARLAAFFWLDEAAMTRLIGGETRINTDDRHYFDSQAAIVPAPAERQLPYFQADAAPCFTSLTAGARRAIADEQLVAFHLGQFAYFRRERALFRAYCLDPSNAGTLYWVDLALGGGKPDPGVLCESEEILACRDRLAANPDDAEARQALADLLGRAGRAAEAPDGEPATR